VKLGFSEHSPLPFDNTFSVKSERMPEYVAEIAALKEEFKDRIEILCGLEADFIPGVSETFAVTKRKYHLDYLIGGVHLVGHSANPEELWFIDGPKWEIYDEGLQKFFGGDIRKGVRAFFDQTNQMIEQEEFDIIAHFDKIKMHNRDRYFH
jgi:histidinol-phosphatase (PHP family)